MVASDALVAVFRLPDVGGRLAGIVPYVTEKKVDPDAADLLALACRLELLPRNLNRLDGAAGDFCDAETSGVPVRQVDPDSLRAALRHRVCRVVSESGAEKNESRLSLPGGSKAHVLPNRPHARCVVRGATYEGVRLARTFVSR